MRFLLWRFYGNFVIRQCFTELVCKQKPTRSILRRNRSRLPCTSTSRRSVTHSSILPPNSPMLCTVTMDPPFYSIVRVNVGEVELAAHRHKTHHKLASPMRSFVLLLVVKMGNVQHRSDTPVTSERGVLGYGSNPEARFIKTTPCSASMWRR